MSPRRPWWEIRPLPDGREGADALSATQLFILSFAGLIAAGTAGFLVLPGLYLGEPLGFVDALFTATSAVCVTGLIVVDTATRFTPAGQAWIALLIQLGGLGILTFTTLVITALGRRSTLRLQEAAGSHARAFGHISVGRLVRSVVGVTLVAETVGALLLWTLWRGEMGSAGALWPATFHAISAFCNAGFSVFSDSLAGFRRSPATLGVVAALVIVGGLGFVVVEDLRARYGRGDRRRLTVHTRIVLLSTGILLVASTLLYLLFESGYLLEDLPGAHRFANAVFMAVTPRTAGFNTVDYGSLTNASLFLTVMLMLVGGAPGSTAGGLKTTTVMLVGLLFWSRIRGEERTSIFGRTIPEKTVDRAVGLTVGGLILVGVFVFLLLAVELELHGGTSRTDFARLVFEAHSAFGTVGLSMGATTTLTSAGRILISILMFLGRVGPLSVVAAMAFAGRRRRTGMRYAHEDVVIG